MRYQLIAILLIASVCGAQTSMPVSSGTASSMPQAPTTPAAPSGSVTIAQGTSIQMALVSPIMSKSTHPGDTVRAVVAFPVTVGTQLAIPAGTYLEGMVTAVSARAPHTHMPSVQIHFTRLLFANGYSVALNGENTQSFLLPDENKSSTVEVAELTPMPFPGARFAMSAGDQPTLPPLPQVGPNPKVLAGIGFGSMVAIAAVTFALMHHRANSYDFIVFDVGWQFQMVLDSPVVLDASQVAAAAAAPSAN